MSDQNDQAVPAADQPKKSLLKRILKWIGIVLLVIVVLLVAALLFINHIAKAAVENVGPLVAKVPFAVNSLRISPILGRVEINHFEMGIPNGYASENSMMLGKVAADVDMGTLTSQKLIIEEIILRDITINYETPLTFTSSNIQDIINNVNMTLGVKKEKDKDEEEHAEAKSEEKPQQKLELDRLVIQNVRLNIVFKQTGITVPLVITLPELGPFGQDDDGLLPAEMVTTVSNAFYEALLKCVSDSKDMLIKSYYKSLSASKSASSSTMKSARKAGNAAVDASGDAAENAVDATANAAEKAANATGEAVRDLFESGKKLFK